MLITVIRKEIQSNLQSSKFFIVLGLAVVLIISSLLFMHRDFRVKLDDYHLVKPKPGAPEVVLPPNPLSVLAKGLDDALTRAFQVESIGISVNAGQKTNNLIFDLFPAPDFLLVVKVVLSLAALLFGFDQISRERELGTLKLVLANALPRSTLLLGKWTGQFICLTAPVTLITVLGFVLIQADPAVQFHPDQLARFGCVLGLTWLYLALFLTLGFLFSILASRTATALIGLLLAWVLLIFLLPNLGTLLARQLTPLPSVQAMGEKRSQIWTREVLNIIQEVQRQPDRDDAWARVSRPRYLAIIREQGALQEHYLNCLEQLSARAKTLNRISPVASFAYAVTGICGTGIGDEIRFKRQLNSYANQTVPLLLSASGGPPSVPAFTCRPLNLAEVVAGGVWLDTLWLLLVNVLLLVAACWSFARLEIQ